MAFQPLGYQFDLKSPIAPPALKALLRNEMKPLLHAKDGARGWIVGPFVCLWFNAVNRGGPMLVGRISQDGLGSRIAGRAGSDLNGALGACVIALISALVVYRLVLVGTYTSGQIALLGGAMIASTFAFFISSHLFRREAEPLIRFVREVATPSRLRPPKALTQADILSGITLDIGGEIQPVPVTADAIYDALFNLGANSFVILARAPENYVQSIFCDGGYTIEWRDGDHRRHFRARRATAGADDGSATAFAFEEMLAIFIAYASDRALRQVSQWEPLRLDR